MKKTNNDKNVYILGAGFSKGLGIPLQDDFLLLAKEVYFRNANKFKHFQSVFDYQNNSSKMRQFLSYPLLNLEHLFNLLEMDLFYTNSSDLENVKTDFIQLICDVLTELTPSPYHNDASGKFSTTNDYKHYLSFLNMFVAEDRRSQIITNGDSIISFNYDLVIETAVSLYNYKRAENIRHKAVYGGDSGVLLLNVLFEKGNIVSKPIKDIFNKKETTSFFPETALYSNSDSAIKYLKLHGSINWELSSNNQLFIVPPTWNKSDTEIRKLWDEAYKELKEAKRIIIIGYSFPETDIYVKSLLALALNENRILQKIVFINPDKDKTQKSSLSLLDEHFRKYCDYKEWYFSDFIGTPEGKKFIEDNLNRSILIPAQ